VAAHGTAHQVHAEGDAVTNERDPTRTRARAQDGPMEREKDRFDKDFTEQGTDVGNQGERLEPGKHGHSGVSSAKGGTRGKKSKAKNRIKGQAARPAEDPKRTAERRDVSESDMATHEPHEQTQARAGRRDEIRDTSHAGTGPSKQASGEAERSTATAEGL
jgi:hypothetical protein